MKITILAVTLSLVLAGCFRDASTSGSDETSVPVLQVQASDTPPVVQSPTIGIPTLTATPELDPSETLAPGGPRVEDDEPTDVPTAEPEADSTSSGVLPPTIAIPSFTPRVSDASTFGDSGITPTSDLATQPVPNALITPTALEDENADSIEDCIHVVQAGETLTRIALQYDVDVEQMIAANPILGGNANALAIGQELAIADCTPTFEEDPSIVIEGQETPTATPEPEVVEDEATDAPITAPDDGTHVVQEGENLFRISLQYGVSVDAIVAANPDIPTQNAIIQPGQVIIIPVGGS